VSGPWEDYQQDGPWADFAPSQPKSAAKPKRSVMGDVTGAMANFNRGLGIGDEMAAAGQTAVNLFAGRTSIKDIPADFKRSMGQQRQIEDSFAAERPRAAALAKGTGMAATAAVPAGNTANLFAQGSRVANAARGATMAGLQGAAYAAADRGTASERLGAASRAARDPVTLGLGAAGGALATPRRAKVPKPVDPDVELLAKEGVQMTPGQMRGGIAKAAEDAGTSQPILGQAITQRREEGFDTFNRAVINRALKQIDETLPDGLTGTDAVKHAGDRLSEGYKTAIPSRMVRADAGFADDARRAFANVETMTPKAQRQLATILDQRVTSRLPQGGMMDGELYKLIQSDLDYEAARFTGSGDADQRAIGQAIEGVQSALENAARRQDPAFAARIDALDRGWAELTRIENAAAKTGDLSGRFTPSQYATAVRSADGRVRKRGVARGEALSQDLAGAAVRVLPSKIGESGTAPRAAWGMVSSIPGAVVGGAFGGGPGAAAGIAGTAASLSALSRMYTPEAVQAANLALSARASDQAKREALAELANMAASDPKVAELYREVAARLSRAAGVAGGARASQPANPFAQP
jgi:hypothetical protein